MFVNRKFGLNNGLKGMSALGQKRTCAAQNGMSALPHRKCSGSRKKLARLNCHKNRLCSVREGWSTVSPAPRRRDGSLHKWGLRAGQFHAGDFRLTGKDRDVLP